jgi:hypothetical protein
LSLQLQNSGLELEDLVLDLAILESGLLRLISCIIDGNIEGFGLGVVGDLVNLIEEIQILLGDIG